MKKILIWIIIALSWPAYAFNTISQAKSKLNSSIIDLERKMPQELQNIAKKLERAESLLSDAETEKDDLEEALKECRNRQNQ